jgi:hypothetical protein
MRGVREEGVVEIDDRTREIKGDWAYFGKMSLNRRAVEYWECPECQR